jgi:hypothetical protein
MLSTENNPFDSFNFDSAPESSATPAAEFTAYCGKCGGSGWFNSARGLKCFECNGAGVLSYKTSPQARQRATQYRAASEQRKAAERSEIVAEWMAEHPAEAAWLTKSAAGFEFAASMLAALEKWGSLTDKQMATVQRLTVQDLDRTAARAAARENAPTINAGKIEEAFATAKGNGIKQPRLRVSVFLFKPAPETGRNAGSIYVTERAGAKTYLGKITSGQFHASRDCAPATSAEIIAAAADPHAAAVAYGRQFGECAICGRELSDPESVQRGIGPICADKWGF